MRIKLVVFLILSFFLSFNLIADEKKENTDIKFYTGIFDWSDENKDDTTDIIGLEHRDDSLYRNTFFGKFLPVTGAFVTGKNSVYFYTGIEAQYSLGPMKIAPSFTPGYYERGDGKDLGSPLEFKSEISLSLDMFENSQIGYSYNHISNNDWGTVNPGTDNQLITFSTKF